MSTLTITAKGQITLNKALLRHLGLKPGDKLEVDEQPNRKLSVSPAPLIRTGRMSDAFGIFHREGSSPLSVEQMDELIGQSRAEDDDRIKAEWHNHRR